jgi:hypothetical protein
MVTRHVAAGPAFGVTDEDASTALGRDVAKEYQDASVWSLLLIHHPNGTVFAPDH